MENAECINLIINILSLATTVAIGYLAYQIGKKQNEINSRSLGLGDYADIFLMPQTIQVQSTDGIIHSTTYAILIKNASSYPIYFLEYVINGVKFPVGGSVIPTSSDNWYAVPISKEIQDKKDFYILVSFEDFSGRKYQAEGFGTFIDSWSVKSKKRIQTN